MEVNKKKKIGRYGVFLILLFEVTLFSLIAKGFLSASNLLNIGRQVSTIGIVSVGMTMLLICGGIDISVGTVVALTGVLCTKLVVEGHLPIIFAVLITIGIGGIVGAFNGFMVTKFKVPAMIATLAMMTMVKGTAYLLTGGIPIYNLPEAYRIFGQGYLGIIPIPLVIMIVIFILGYWMMEKTYLGRHIYATGGNEEAARLSGINTVKIQILVYVICSILTAIAGIITSSRINSGQPSIGVGFEMDVITASVLGGVSLMGGEGRILNVIAGVLIMGTLSNGMVLMDLGEYSQWVVKGVVLLCAVAFDNIQKGLVKRNS